MKSKIETGKVYRMPHTRRKMDGKKLAGILVRLHGEELMPEPSLTMVTLYGELIDGVQPSDLELTEFKWEDLQPGAMLAVAWGDGHNYPCFIRKHNVDGFLVTYPNEDDELVELYNITYNDVKAAAALPLSLPEREFQIEAVEAINVWDERGIDCCAIFDFAVGYVAWLQAHGKIKSEAK